MSEPAFAESKPESGHVDENPATRWRQIIERQRSSGQGVSAFCRDNGIKPSSFFAWRRRLAGGDTGTGVGKFIEVKTSAARGKPLPSSVKDDDGLAADASSSIELRLVCGHRLLVRRGFDRQLLLDLLDVLETCP